MEYMDGHATGRRSIEAALRHFGLDELSDFPAAYLSAGQRRRLGLARLLVAERPVWLLDEPTASLDSASSERLVDAVNTHTSKGGIAVIATHLPIALERARALELAVQRIAA
jgi:heme exporter protein A